MVKNKTLALPFRSLCLILELGISQGVFGHWERPICVRAATLSAGIPVAIYSTLPSSLRKKHQSHQELS